MKTTTRLIASVLVPGSLILATFTSTQPAIADGPEMSLKDRRQWDEMTKHIEEKAKAASEKCETPIVARFDIPSFKGQDLFRQSPTAYCRDAINTVTALCATDVGKAAVKRSISTITCRRSNDGTKVEREGTALSIYIDPAKTAIKGKAKGVSSWKSALEEIL